MIGAIILAAGQAKRMGEPKLLLPWAHHTVVEEVVANVLAGGVEEAIVVVGHRAGEMAQRLKGQPVRIVVNPAYARGMSTSLVRGLQALEREGEGIMVVLGDQPAIPPELFREVIRAFRQHPQRIIVPVFKGKRGHPVIFPAAYKAQLLALTGDRGAKGVIEANPEAMLEVEVASDTIIADMDDRREYLNLRQKFAPPPD